MAFNYFNLVTEAVRGDERESVQKGEGVSGSALATCRREIII